MERDGKGSEKEVVNVEVGEEERRGLQRERKGGLTSAILKRMHFYYSLPTEFVLKDIRSNATDLWQPCISIGIWTLLK